MAKRKRGFQSAQARKRSRKDTKPQPSHYVLSTYFPTLVTLRQYLIARLSNSRRSTQQHGLQKLQSDQITPDSPLYNLLDLTLVGLEGDISSTNPVTDDIIHATASSQCWSASDGPPQSEVCSEPHLEACSPYNLCNP